MQADNFPKAKQRIFNELVAKMNQIEKSGLGSFKELRSILLENNFKRIFIISRESIISKITELLDQIELFEKYNIYVFTNYTPNPKYEDVLEGVKLAKNYEPDCFIAVGGGSSIDVMKLINYFNVTNVQPLIDSITNVRLSDLTPMIAIPTTCGTGSEATEFAVVYQNRKKYSITHKELLPNYVLLDPELLQDLPLTVLYSSILDSLCQAIESYWSINSNDESKFYSIKSLQIINDNLKYDNENKYSLSELLLASNYSGKAINIARTTASHAISYPLTAYFNIPHGLAVVLTLPSLFLFNSKCSEVDCNDQRGVDYVRSIIQNLLSLLKLEKIDEILLYFNKILDRFNIRKNLSDYNINKDDIERILIPNAFNERIQNNPRKINHTNIREIIYNSL